MISKEEAIKILDNYIELEHNVDPLSSTILKAHRLFVSENHFYWRLIQSAEGDIYKENGFEGNIGGGVFFIDKDNGEIFGIGSPVLFDWEEEFNKFKRGENSEIEWKPLINTYLDCEIVNQLNIKFEQISLRCKYSEKEKSVRDFLIKKKNEIKDNLNPILINKAFDSDEGELILGINGEAQTLNINLIQKNFVGGLKNYTAALRDVKKWVRVNGRKLTDNYWIEIEEREFEKEFSDWELKFNMEFK
jgi:hypothetical protein